MGPRAECTPGDALHGASGDLSVARLVVDDLAIEHGDDTLSISARVRWDQSSHPPPVPEGERLTIEIADLDRLGCDRRHLLAAHTPPHATALVPVVAAIAAASGADLTIDAPVCPVALAGARRAVALGHATHRWPAVTLGATAGATVPSHRGGAGVIFGLDLDGLATLLTLQCNGHAPTHLIAIDNLDEPLGARPPGAPSAALTAGRDRAQVMAANEARLPMIRVSTNARRFTDPLIDWSIARHAAIASCSLALAGVVSSVTVPTAATPAAASAEAFDSLPSDEGLWSSAAVELHGYAEQLSSTDGVALVGTDPWAARWLRVCGVGTGDTNCGLCRPCQLALARLWLAGADVGTTAFGHPLDPAVVRHLPAVPLASPGEVLVVIERLRLVANGWSTGAAGTNADERLVAAALADAWADHLASWGRNTPATVISA